MKKLLLLGVCLAATLLFGASVARGTAISQQTDESSPGILSSTVNLGQGSVLGTTGIKSVTLSLDTTTLTPTLLAAFSSNPWNVYIVCYTDSGYSNLCPDWVKDNTWNGGIQYLLSEQATTTSDNRYWTAYFTDATHSSNAADDTNPVTFIPAYYYQLVLETPTSAVPSYGSAAEVPYYVIESVDTPLLVPPTLTSVAIASSNASSTLAKVGDTISISFISDVALGFAVATIAGQNATLATTTPTSYIASFMLTQTETEGSIPFSISYGDFLGTAGFVTSTTTNNSLVVFDKTAPTVFFTSAPAEGATSTSPITFAFTSDAPTVCAFDSEAAVSCSASVATTTTDGAHTLVITAADDAGNTFSLRRIFVVETPTPPAPTPTPEPTPTSSSGGGGGNGLAVNSGPLAVGFQFTPPTIIVPTVPAQSAPVAAESQPIASSPAQNNSTPTNQVVAVAPAPIVTEEISEPEPTSEVVAYERVPTPWDIPTKKNTNSTLTAAVAGSGFEFPSWAWIGLVALGLLLAGGVWINRKA